MTKTIAVGDRVRWDGVRHDGAVRKIQADDGEDVSFLGQCGTVTWHGDRLCKEVDPGHEFGLKTWIRNGLAIAWDNPKLHLYAADSEGGAVYPCSEFELVESATPASIEFATNFRKKRLYTNVRRLPTPKKDLLG